MITRNEFSAQLREQLENSDAYPAWDEEAVWKKIVATQAAPRKGFRFWVLLLSLPFLTVMSADCSLQHTAPEVKYPEIARQQPVAKLNQAIKKEASGNDVHGLNTSTIAHSKQQPIKPIALESKVPDLPTLDSPLIAILIDRNTCIRIETEWLVAHEFKDQYHFLDLFRPTQDSTLSLPPEIKLKTF